MSRMWIIVGVGGALGSIARYLSAAAVTRWLPSAFPWGTFGVNVVGSLAIGLVIGLSQRHGWSDPWRIFLATGFCGGFTTFSSFSLENVQLMRQGDYGVFAAYASASLVLCLLATAAGLFLSNPNPS